MTASVSFFVFDLVCMHLHARLKPHTAVL